MSGEDDLRRAIATLLVRAGMLMEDVSPDAVSALPTSAAALKQRTRKLARAGDEIRSLTAAAALLAEALPR